jgi:hypothetical protein
MLIGKRLLAKELNPGLSLTLYLISINIIIYVAYKILNRTIQNAEPQRMQLYLVEQ